MLKKVLSSLVAVAMFATMAISASAAVTNPNTDDGKYAFDVVEELGDDFSKVTKVTVQLTPADKDIPEGIGGGLALNSESNEPFAWIEFGNEGSEKAIIVTEDFKLVYDHGKPIFAESDAESAKILIEGWWGSDFTVDSIEYGYADDDAADADDADETPAEDEETPADDDKAPATDKNPTTGVGGIMALVGISSLAATSLVVSKKRK